MGSRMPEHANEIAIAGGLASRPLAATNAVFGDPCGGTYKYLTVNYLCNTAPTPQEAGCYDATREGFLDIETYPKIAACGTGYQGLRNVDVSDIFLSLHLHPDGLDFTCCEECHPSKRTANRPLPASVFDRPLPPRA